MKDRFPTRFVAYGLVIFLLFGVLFFNLAGLQLRPDEDYGAKAEAKKTKTITSRGDRGSIIDSESKPLAYDKKIYDIKFYRDPTWKSTEKEINSDGEEVTKSALKVYTQSLLDAIDIIERNGGEVKIDFALVQDEATGEWAFDWGDITPAAQARREELWRTNFYLSAEKVPVEAVFDTLCERYGIADAQRPDQPLSLDRKLQILSIWQTMQMNAFLSKPITVASNVSWNTVIEIEAKALLMEGVSVAVSTQRQYPNGTLACHVIGYIGKIQNYDTYYNSLQAKGYALDDLIGLDGVEKTMEDWLTASSSQRQGKKVVEIDRFGAVNRTLSNIEPQNGNNVKLTINTAMQKVAEDALADNILTVRALQEEQLVSAKWRENNKEELESGARNFDKYPIQLAEKGAIVVLDMQGRVLAMASYPPYDPNVFIAGGKLLEEVMTDSRNPLLNYSIGSIDAPGSIFKMVTASAAMASGNLSPFDKISDGGDFDLYDNTSPPRCWVPRGQEYRHADQTVVQGLSNSCNYFFYTISAKMGGDILYKYSALYGLTSKTGVELPGELQGIVGNQDSLYNPNKAIKNGQSTSLPYLVSESIKGHLMKIGRERNIEFDEEKLDKTAKRLLDMAYETEQVENVWVRHIRTILLEELDMPHDLIYLQRVVGELYIKLNDIKWGGSYTIMTGIGQGITMVSPIAVARYVAAVANGGTVYDVTLIDSIISPEGEVLSAREPTISSTLPEVEPYLPFIRMGMQGVVDEGGTARKYFSDWSDEDLKQIAAKTGTAETTNLDLENNAWFVAFAPYENPEIAVVCYIPNGWGGSRAAPAVSKVLKYYLESRQAAGIDLMGPANELAY